MSALDSIPTIAAADMPSVTRAQMREVDRLMIEEYGVQLLQMMENAGLQLAQLARVHLDPPIVSRRVVVLAGRGNNGGGGLTAARRLASWGVGVRVVLTDERAGYRDAPALQLASLDAMDVPVTTFDGTLRPHDLLIDAIIGYGLDGPAKGVVRDLIAATTGSRAIALDVPSGVDVDSGEALGRAVRAEATLTLALPKAGLLESNTRAFVGELYLADISVPPALYANLGLTVPPLFVDGPLIRIAR